MSFWVWVGVAIVVVLLVLVFVRDRFEARHSGGTGTLTPSVAMTDTMANPVRCTNPIRQALPGVSPEHPPPLAVGIPARREEIRAVPKVRQNQ